MLRTFRVRARYHEDVWGFRERVYGRVSCACAERGAGGRVRGTAWRCTSFITTSTIMHCLGADIAVEQSGLWRGWLLDTARMASFEPNHYTTLRRRTTRLKAQGWSSRYKHSHYPDTPPSDSIVYPPAPSAHQHICISRGIFRIVCCLESLSGYCLSPQWPR